MSHGGAARHRLVALMAVLVVCTRPSYAGAQGGPPLLTDDPDTPGPGHWEINLAAIIEHTRDTRTLELPRVDLNYGAGERIQLKLEMPWVRAAPSAGPSEDGLGGIVIGTKWRFLGGEG